MTEAGLDEQTAHETYSAVSELVRGRYFFSGWRRNTEAAREMASGDDDGFAAATPSQDNRAFELLLTSVLTDVWRSDRTMSRCTNTSRREGTRQVVS